MRWAVGYSLKGQGDINAKGVLVSIADEDVSYDSCLKAKRVARDMILSDEDLDDPRLIKMHDAYPIYSDWSVD